ncbi:MAG: calcium/sodium antiporter [Bacteroidetes bacterium]|nr:calcium/sodium antiporter [Bacteroidota bacterium]
MNYLILLAGFITLLLSGDFLVRGGVSLARHFRISTLVVGMTVVSLGTSAPELFVSLKATLNSQPDFATGTVIGSNISNIALVLGLTAIILPIAVNKRSTLFDWPVMMSATLLFFVFILDGWLNFYEGLVFVILLGGFIVFSIYQSRRKEKTAGANVVQPKYSLLKSLLIILSSAVGLYFGAEWLIKGASEIAKSFDISEYLISVSVVAFGTSVPELATSVVAAFKKETDISIGNIIGSNMFNIMGILGITALVKPLRLNEQIRSFDMYWLIGLCALLFLMMLPVKSGKISRIKGVVLLISYIVYLAIIYSGDAIVN